MASDYNDGCGYVAIPLETLDRVEELIEEATGSLYVGNTQKAMIALNKLSKEVTGYGSTEKVNESEK